MIKDLAASRHRLCIDTSLYRTVALAELANAIPRSSYLFGVSVALTLAASMIPADGFYEWKKVPGGGKIPYAIGMKDDAAFVFAGLCEGWKERPNVLVNRLL